MRARLVELLSTCPRCSEIFNDNIATIVPDDDGVLTDEQVQAVLEHLQKRHQEHEL